MKAYVICAESKTPLEKCAYLIKESYYGESFSKSDLYHIEIFKTKKRAEKKIEPLIQKAKKEWREEWRIHEIDLNSTHVKECELSANLDGTKSIDGHIVYFREPIKNLLRQAIYDKGLGKDGKHHCWYCGKPIGYGEMCIDHFKSVKKGGSSEIWNLVPSCRECNNMKFAMTIEEYRNMIPQYEGTLIKNDIKFRQLMAHGVIKNTGEPIKFWFERNKK